MEIWVVVMVVWAISLIAAGGVGYHYSTVVKRVNLIAKALLERKPKPEPEAIGKVIDPEDPVQQVRNEFDETTRKLNP